MKTKSQPRKRSFVSIIQNAIDAYLYHVVISREYKQSIIKGTSGVLSKGSTLICS